MEGFENTPNLKQVDEYGIKIKFCPGKATWFSETNKLFSECFIAIHSGFLPRNGGLENQDAKFTEVFPEFVERWEYRKKVRLWSDVHEFAGKCFEAIGKMFGSK